MSSVASNRSSANNDLFVSVVSVLHNQAEVLEAFVNETLALLAASYKNFELLLIDNASGKATSQAARRLLTRHKCLRYQRLTRPVDDETAIIVGLDSALGDYVVTIHADYDPPDKIVPMVELCQAGHDVVLGVDRSMPPAGPIYRLCSRLFRKLTTWVVHLEVPVGTTGFRVFSRQAVNAITRVRSRRRYFALLAAEIGLSTQLYPYIRGTRSGAHPQRSLMEAVRIGASVLVHYSILPMRLASLLGLVGSGLCLLDSVYVVMVYLFKPDVMPGWTTLSLQVSGLFTLVFFILALMGEYVGRLLEESTDRPLYYVHDEESSTVMLADRLRRNVTAREEGAAWNPAPGPADRGCENLAARKDGGTPGPGGDA